MKRAIIVRGRSGSGKSTALLSIRSWLLSSYSCLLLYDAKWGGPDVFEIYLVGTLRVAIFTAGDEGPGVQSTLHECIFNNCDLIIGACRGKGSTYRITKTTLAYPAFIINWVHTYKVGTHLVPVFHAQWVSELEAQIRGVS